MTQPRAITRFCGSPSLHYVTIASPLCRDPKLISNNMAAVLALFDGLTLVCSAAARVEGPTDERGRSTDVDILRDPD